LQSNKLACDFCHTYFAPDDKVSMVNGIPYHPHHTPDKTEKLNKRPVVGVQQQELQRPIRQF